MQSPTSRAIIAAAGSGKTEYILDAALAEPSKRILITTYTNENRQQILARIQEKAGVVPANVAVMGWFTFLINECARPYQSALTDKIGDIRSLNFDGKRNLYTKRDSMAYYFDSKSNMYRDGVSDFVHRLDVATGGGVIRRLASIYDCIYVDEVQDMVGYDLDVLALLVESSIDVTMVGDPRQYTYSTNDNPRNKKYRGAGIVLWFQERETACTLEHQAESHRCNQAICDFADALYPDLHPTTSCCVTVTEHDGVFAITREEVPAYIDKYRPVVLRYDIRSKTGDLPAMNIGVAKGSTFDRVLIFGTKSMVQYYDDRDLSKLGSKAKLYVAVTRARHSATLVRG